MESDQVVGVGESRSTDPDLSGSESIDLYLIPIRNSRFALFLTRRSLSTYARSETDRFLRFIRRMMRSKNAIIRWVGRVSRAGHRYYQRLEDRIDPIERMVKALNFPGTLVVWHAPALDVRREIREFLGRQVVKHTTWVCVNGVVTAVAIVLAPLMAPIPGPNVAFFYPFLRLLSHIQALRGARRAQSDATLVFRQLPDLEAYGRRDTPLDWDGEPVEGLRAFLERVG